jgi:hypothetical protein
MSMLAFLRADDTIVPLFLHIAGAMVLVGALTLSSVSLISAWGTGSAALIRLGYRSLFYAALPGYIVFRVGAQWILDTENLTDSKDAWIGIGYGVSDLGFLLLLVSLIVGGISVRKMNRGEQPSRISTRIVTGLVSFVLVAYLVAVWAMAVKPT